MKLSTIYKIAEENNYTVCYKRYEYWNNVLFLNDTAICFDVKSEYGNTRTIRTDSEYFPSFVTKEYLKECVENNYPCLGVIDYRRKHTFGGKTNIPIVEVCLI